MKVAIIVNELDVRGGTQKQILRFIEYLSAQNITAKIYANFFNSTRAYPEFVEYPIEYFFEEKAQKIQSKNKLVLKIQNLKRAFEFLKKIDKDIRVINVHDNALEKEILLLRLTRGKRIKIVWQINDLPDCFHVGVHANKPDSIKQKLRRAYIRLVAKCVDEITVNVTKNAERVEQCFGRKAKVFYCGVDVNESLEKHSYNIKDNTVRILSSGVFFPYRNYETLIDVVENLKKQNINIHLDVIGATDRCPTYSEKIISLVKEKQLENEITIWGQVDDEKYNELHNRADMFAFININQSWGLAVFEAMSCGLPVIVSESVGAIELLHNNEDAVIVDPENAEEVSDVVLKLMNDKDYYNKISQNAYNAVKEFTWDKLYSERMLELFKQLTQ